MSLIPRLKNTTVRIISVIIKTEKVWSLAISKKNKEGIEISGKTSTAKIVLVVIGIVDRARIFVF